jgi:large subunit ribosomal protein L10e
LNNDKPITATQNNTIELGIRPARCYRAFITPPYTRKEYIKGVPGSKITKFTMGNPNGDFDTVFRLVVREGGQIRHNALEAARNAAHKILADALTEQGFDLRITKYPHHVIRENKMMAFAGADRLQDGMRLSFGKPAGLAVRVNSGDSVLLVRANKSSEEVVKRALRLAGKKLPLGTAVLVEEGQRAEKSDV